MPSKGKKINPVFLEKEIAVLAGFIKFPPVIISFFEWLLKFGFFLTVLYSYFLIILFLVNRKLELIYKAQLKNVTIPTNLFNTFIDNSGLLFLLILSATIVGTWGFYHFWQNRRLGWVIGYFIYLINIITAFITNNFFGLAGTIIGLLLLFQVRERFTR